MDNSIPVNATNAGYKQPDITSVGNVELPSSDVGRVLPRQISTGSMRGTQTIGYGGVKIDGSNNRITISDGIVLDGSKSTITIGSNILLDAFSSTIKVTNTDGSIIGMGKIPDGSGFGFFAQDSKGNLLYTIIGSTQYVYDISQTPHTNVMQIMKLPDGTYGMAVAQNGFNVSSGF